MAKTISLACRCLLFDRLLTVDEAEIGDLNLSSSLIKAMNPFGFMAFIPLQFHALLWGLFGVYDPTKPHGGIAPYKQRRTISEQVKHIALVVGKASGFPPYRNKPNGLGIYYLLLEHVIYMSRERWTLAPKLYRMFVKFSVWMREGGWKARIYKTGTMLYPDMERPTSTAVMPLNVDMAD